MATRSLKQDDPLDDFVHREITLDGVTKIVHVAGIGLNVRPVAYENHFCKSGFNQRQNRPQTPGG